MDSSILFRDSRRSRKGYPALKLIFLMAMAESVTKQKLPKNKIGHFRAIEEFFQCLREEDKKRLINSFKPAITKSQNFRFSSILKILYEVRNRAVHGEDYYSFDLLNQKDKDRHRDYNDFGIMTSGYLGKPNKKRRISLDINLTYEELREIFIRTAIANIQSLL